MVREMTLGFIHVLRYVDLFLFPIELLVSDNNNLEFLQVMHTNLLYKGNREFYIALSPQQNTSFSQGELKNKVEILSAILNNRTQVLSAKVYNQIYIFLWLITRTKLDPSRVFQ